MVEGGERNYSLLTFDAGWVANKLSCIEDCLDAVEIWVKYLLYFSIYFYYYTHTQLVYQVLKIFVVKSFTKNVYHLIVRKHMI